METRCVNERCLALYQQIRKSVDDIVRDKGSADLVEVGCYLGQPKRWSDLQQEIPAPNEWTAELCFVEHSIRCKSETNCALNRALTLTFPLSGHAFRWARTRSCLRAGCNYCTALSQSILPCDHDMQGSFKVAKVSSALEVNMIKT